MKIDFHGSGGWRLSMVAVLDDGEGVRAKRDTTFKSR